MTNDFISRQAAIDALAKHEKSNGHNYTLFVDIVSECAEIIRDLPSAEPERKKGEWIVTSEFEDCRYAKCDQCKVTQVFYFNKPFTDFCPNCGADMRGKIEAEGDEE